MCCALKQPSIAACPVGGSIFLAGTADTQTCSAVQPENTCVVELIPFLQDTCTQFKTFDCQTNDKMDDNV